MINTVKKTTGKSPKLFHTPKSNKNPGGTYYGQGVKNPMGKPIETMATKVSGKSKKGKAPRSLA